jgi:hypothetical protein
LVVIAATNPQFTADPLDERSNNPHSQSFAAAGSTPGQKPMFGRDRPSHIGPNHECPIPDIDLPLRNSLCRQVFLAAAPSFLPQPSLSCRSQVFLAAQVFSCHTRADTRQIAKHPGGGELRP